MGVEMTLEALMISFSLGTPSVTFILATPAKWNVLSVIWVPERSKEKEGKERVRKEWDGEGKEREKEEEMKEDEK